MQQINLPDIQKNPLSSMIRLGEPNSESILSKIWAWHSPTAGILVQALHGSGEQPAEDLESLLGIKDWQVVPGSEANPFLVRLSYLSQLRNCVFRLTEEELNAPQILTHPADIGAMIAIPIMLASKLPSMERNVTHFFTQRFPPAPEHGTAGIVCEGDQFLAVYGIEELPQEAQQLQIALSHALAALPDNPQEVLHVNGDVRIVLHEFPKELVAMVHELAKAYLTHHQQQKPTEEPQPSSLFPDIEPIKKQKRPYLPALFDTRGYAPIVSSLPMQAVISGTHNAIAGAPDWKFQANERFAPFFKHITKTGQTIVEYKRGEDSIQPDEKQALQLWNEVKSLNPNAIDILLDIFCHLSRNGQDGKAWLFASQHLDNRGLQQISKAGSSGKRWNVGHRTRWMPCRELCRDEALQRRGFEMILQA